MTTPPPPPAANPYQIGSLIFALTTPPERTSKVAPQWKGPYHICRIPNEYQAVYEDGNVERTIHINHAKPAKFTAPDLPEPVPPTETPRPPLGYLPAGLACRPAKPRVPPADSSVAPAPPATPAENSMPPPAAAPANQQPEPAPPRRRSPRLNPVQGHAHTIKSPPAAPPHHSSKSSEMARTFPLTVHYNECLGRKANPLSFASLRLVDLRNSHSQYLGTVVQLMDALPKSMDPASRFALQGHIARPGQTRLCHSMRAAYGFCCPLTGPSPAHRHHFSISSQTRDGVWSYEGVHETTPPPSRDHGRRTSLPQKNPASSPRR